MERDTYPHRCYCKAKGMWQAGSSNVEDARANGTFIQEDSYGLDSKRRLEY